MGHIFDYMNRARPEAIEDIYHKWDRIGLLEGLTPNDARELAVIYEHTVDLLVHDPLMVEQSVDDTQFETIIFPVLRRIYTRLHNPYLDIRRVYKETREMVDSNEFKNAVEMMINNRETTIDFEAEMVAAFAENYKDDFFSPTLEIMQLTRPNGIFTD